MKKINNIYRTKHSAGIFCIVFLCCQCNKKKEPFQILAFESFDKIDSTFHGSLSMPFSKEDNYLVNGFENSKRDIYRIDSFICNKISAIDSIADKYVNYSICFYDKIKITNYDHAKKNYKDYRDYCDEVGIICVYQWYDRGFIGRYNSTGWLSMKYLKCK